MSKSSLSLWLRDIVLTEEQAERLAAMRVARSTQAGQTIRARRLARQQATVAEARARIPDLAESELFVAGLALYWAEGSKSKPWRPGEGVALINSDPDVIRLFLAWLRLLGIDRDRLVFANSIHERADVVSAEAYWRQVVGVPVGQFRKPVLKRHNSRTVRKNTGDTYRGCLIVYVRRGTDLARRIEGWWRGLVDGIDTLDVSAIRGGVIGSTGAFEASSPRSSRGRGAMS